MGTILAFVAVRSMCRRQRHTANDQFKCGFVRYIIYIYIDIHRLLQTGVIAAQKHMPGKCAAAGSTSPFAELPSEAEATIV